MSHESFIKGLEKQSFTKQAELLKKVRLDHPDGKILTIAMGEKWGQDGIVEQQIKNEDGMFLKLYGCSYLIKGSHSEMKLRGMELSKSFLSHIPMQFIAKDWLLSLVFIYRAIFTKKKFIDELDYILFLITQRNIVYWEIPEAEYNLPVRELRRAGYKVLKNQYGIDASIHLSPQIDNGKTPSFPASHKIIGSRMAWMLARLLRFITFFLQYDTAYWYRVQDAFGGVTQKGLAAFYEGLEILLSRERGVSKKWTFISRGIKVIFWLYPEIKNCVNSFFSEVDLSKIAPDEADIYFMQGYYSYDFQGKSFEVRQAERKKIDEEKGHIMLFI